MDSKTQQNIALDTVGNLLHEMGVKEGLRLAARLIDDPGAAPSARAAIALELRGLEKGCHNRSHTLVGWLDSHVYGKAVPTVFPARASCFYVRRLPGNADYDFAASCVCGCDVDENDFRSETMLGDDKALNAWVAEHSECLF